MSETWVNKCVTPLDECRNEAINVIFPALDINRRMLNPIVGKTDVGLANIRSTEFTLPDRQDLLQKMMLRCMSVDMRTQTMTLLATVDMPAQSYFAYKGQFGIGRCIMTDIPINRFMLKS